MSKRRKSVVKHNGPKRSAHETVVDAIFSEIVLNRSDGETDEIDHETILDGYEDYGYTDTISDAKKWVSEKGESFFERTFPSGSDAEREKNLEKQLIELDQKITSYHEGKTSEKEVKAAISNMFQHIGRSPFWNMYPMDEDWHTARMESAIFQINKLSDQFRSVLRRPSDVFYGIAVLLLRGQNLESLDEPRANSNDAINEAVRLHDEMAELYFKLGFLYRDTWWIENHEDAAAGYYEQTKKRKDGSKKGAKTTANKAAALRADCLGFVAAAYEEKGMDFIVAKTSIQATTIMGIAQRERPSDFVGPHGKPLSHKWFVETLEGFGADGRLGETIKAVIKNKA